jgi:hypothetical protein
MPNPCQVDMTAKHAIQMIRNPVTRKSKVYRRGDSICWRNGLSERRQRPLYSLQRKGFARWSYLFPKRKKTSGGQRLIWSRLNALRLAVVLYIPQRRELSSVQPQGPSQFTSELVIYHNSDLDKILPTRFKRSKN